MYSHTPLYLLWFVNHNQRIPVVHERRRFTDIMDEEIDDERKRTLVDRYSAGFVRQNATTCSLDLPRRVANEVSKGFFVKPKRAAEDNLWFKSVPENLIFKQSD